MTITFKRTLATILLIAMLGVCVLVATACSKTDTPYDNNAELSFEQQLQDNMVLALSNPVYMASTQSVTYTITASISPSDVENKQVDWSIAWSEDAPLKESNISNYLTITPESDGSSVATVACFKSFRDSTAVITATSREGGCKANCLVTYTGKPTNIALNTSSMQTVARGNITAYKLYRGQTYNLDISMSNIFNDVGSEYGNYTVKVEGIGTFIKGTKYMNTSGTTWQNEETVKLDTVKNDYISASSVDGKLRITGIDRYENMQGNMDGGSNHAWVYDCYKQDNTVDGALPYFKVTITENESKLSKSFNFYVVASVSSVDLSTSTITF